MELIGSRYGGYVVPRGVLGRDSIVYSAGVGEDASFDAGVVDRYGCVVHLFDPTPRSIVYFNHCHAGNKKLQFHTYGLWNADAEMWFWRPANREHVSHSIHNLQGTDDYFTGDVKRVETIMRELGHTRIDLLKLDIEGAEYEVLDDMMNDSGVFPQVICVEFHRRKESAMKTDWTVQMITGHGYVVVSRDGQEMTFVRKA
jgi:FkbM family methyltransferase